MARWFSIPYSPHPEGYWLPVTATLNWCEEDYYATRYAAELVNAFTNLLFFTIGVKGVLSCRRNGHDMIFQVAYFGYLLVGFGSFLFHATLKYPMQLVDELSMIYTTCLMCYASFSYSKPTAVRLALGIFLTALAVFITLYYHYLQDPAFHQAAYALLTTVVVLHSMYTMEVTLRPKWRRSREEDRLIRKKNGLPIKSREHQEYDNQRDLQTLRTMWFMVVYGLSMFLGGFLVWSLDNVYCSRVRAWRRYVGLPWGLLLEGHGWWHLMTGVGAYLYIIWGIWLRHILNNRQHEYELVWKHIWHAPEIARVQKSYTNGAAAKKAV